MCQHLLLRSVPLSAATPSFVFVFVSCRAFLVFAKRECRDRLARITLRSVNSSGGLSGVVPGETSRFCRRQWACCLTRQRPDTTPPLSLNVATHPCVTWLIQSMLCGTWLIDTDEAADSLCLTVRHVDVMTMPLCYDQYVTRKGSLCCSVLQCVAVCCRVLHCVAVLMSPLRHDQYDQYVTRDASICCIVLQCVAVCCSVLQCVVN